ncbi:MAG: winged helix-turn-helix transcriptional regulator [Vulcanisaeta sp.]
MNARASVSEIAEKLGVSRATVSRAIRSLVNKGG